ncbi:MAG: protein-L-isoaspartate and D-aspartate O-methyltransferase, partial [Myxococcales bacterium]|nr:protein-L-isoaspartate and D-aspartate O-methyltransferase [Myxococcales bacterium]
VPAQLVAQLAPHGRLVVPVGRSATQSLRIIRRTDHGLTMTDAGGCVFVPLVGESGFRPPG